MIKLESTTDINLIKNIITNPKLYKLTFGSCDNLLNFEVNTSFHYLLILQNNNKVGLIQIRPKTNLIMEVHILILPEYWGTGVSLEAVKEGHTWIKSKGYLKTYTQVPKNCLHMLKYIKRIEYKQCGEINNGIMYRNKIVPLLLFEHEV